MSDPVLPAERPQPPTLDDIMAAFVHAEDQYGGCKAPGSALGPKFPGSHAPFWCYWNAPNNLCTECAGFKADIARHLHGLAVVAR